MSKNLIVDWPFVFSLKEFNQYFNLSELLVQSKLSKFIRVKHSPHIFKSVNTHELITFALKDTTLCSRDIVTVELLNFKFRHIVKFVNSIEFNMDTDALNTPVIVSYFKFLTNLTMIEFIIPYQTIKIIFKGLTNTTTLKLKYCLILFRPNARKTVNIKLPSNLINLELIHNAGLSTTEYDNIRKFVKLQTMGASDTTPINLSFSTKFNNLKKFRFIKGNDKNHSSLKSIIQNNLKLEILEIYFDQLTLDIYECLANCNNLQSITIYPANGVFTQLEFNNFPTFPSVKKLNLYQLVSYSEDILNYLISPFININHLIISNLGSWKGQIHQLVKSLKLLEKLTVYCSNEDDLLNSFVISSNTLITLELLEFEELNFKFNILSNCPSIKRVKICTKYFLIGSNSSFLTKLKKSTNWKIIKFEDSINCYKLN